MNFLVVGGNGGIGKKRVEALSQLKEEGSPIEYVFVYDPSAPFVPTHERKNIPYFLYPDEAFNPDVKFDWVFISTPHDVSANWIGIASEWGSKILVEKPFGRNFEEAKKIYMEAKNPENIYVGFNYRFYEAIKHLKSNVADSFFGKIFSVNMTIGHGGKPEDATSWKLDPIKGAPDSLLDPGIHMLDILNHVFGMKIIPIAGKSSTGFWDTGVKEDVCMLLSLGEFPVTLNSSIVRWRNTFEIQVNGENGYGVVSGRGGNYGTQTYTIGERWGWKKGLSQKESEVVISYSDCADSFYKETKSLITDHTNNCTSREALSVMGLYKECTEVLK